MKAGRSVYILAKIAISAAALAYVFTRRVDLRSLQSARSATNLYWLLPSAIMALLVRWLTAVQFHRLAGSLGPAPSVPRIMKAQLIASLFSTFSPGEVLSSSVSWHYLARDQRNYANTGAVLVYLKLVTYASISLVALLGVVLEPGLRSMHVAALASAVLLACAVSAVPFWHGPSAAAARRGAEAIARALPLGRWSHRVQTIPSRLLVLHELPSAQLFSPVLLSLLINIVGAIGIGFTLQAGGVRIPWHACLWLRAVLTVVQAVPISIAGTGVRELTLVFLLGRVFGSPSAHVIIASLLILGVNLFFGLLIGGVLFLLDRGSSPLGAIADDDSND
jgi:hypothetical protein